MLKKEGNGWAKGAEDVRKERQEEWWWGGGVQSVVGIRQRLLRATVCVEAAGQRVKVQKREKLAVAST